MRYIKLIEKTQNDVVAKFLNEASITLIEPYQNNTRINYGHDKYVIVVESPGQAILMLEQNEKEVVFDVAPRTPAGGTMKRSN